MKHSCKELDIILTKEFLIEKYLNNKIPMYLIGKLIGCSENVIKSRLIKYGIPIRNISESKIGKPSPFKGHSHSKESKEKISNSNTNKILDQILTKEFLQENYVNKKISRKQLSKIIGCSSRGIRDRLIRNNISLRSKGGENCHFWKGGITSLHTKIRNLQENVVWKKEVLKRVNYICQGCGVRGGKLEAHHIKEFSKIFAEFLQEYNQFSPIDDKETLLRLAINYKPFWDINNGKALCFKCHCLV